MRHLLKVLIQEKLIETLDILNYVRNEMQCSSHDDMTQNPIKSDFYAADYDKKWDVYTREAAINASYVLRKLCNKTVFYIDLGWSTGMKSALEYCKTNNLLYETRNLNYENVLSLNSLIITREFIDAIVKNKPYAHFLEGTPLEKN